jgi:anti-sigma B factor antagonist
MAPVLSIQSSREGDRHTLTLTGRLDIASTPVLEAKASQLVSEGARELVLDLGQLEFIDSSGLTSILRVRSLCEEHMCDFALTPGERPVQRIFEVTRLIDRLPFRRARHAKHHDGRAEADADASQPAAAEGEA